MFNPQKETSRIIKFIRLTLQNQGFKKVVIAVSGGVDSATCLLLLAKAIKPKNITVLKLPYANQDMSLADMVIKAVDIPKINIFEVNIKPAVETIIRLNQGKKLEKSKIRLGNIMVRLRMVFLFDLAKKNHALVCGTENKTEHLLGYFTRFGDEASDFEPIRHLYKTEVLKLAFYLDVPEKIISQAPTAGLWPGQTDEGEFGFSYKEADQVLKLYLEKKLKLKEIEKKGFTKTGKIISRVKQNLFKHQTPYSLSSRE